MITIFVFGKQRVQLPCGEYLIGRSRRCAIRLNDPYVSRVQLRCQVSPDEVAVEDLGGKNRVQLNRKPLQGISRLADGDEIVLGGTRIRVELELVRRNQDFDDDVVTLTGAGFEPRVELFGCPACNALVDTELELCPYCGHSLRSRTTRTQELPIIK